MVGHELIDDGRGGEGEDRDKVLRGNGAAEKVYLGHVGVVLCHPGASAQDVEPHFRVTQTGFERSPTGRWERSTGVISGGSAGRGDGWTVVGSGV